MPSSYTPSNRFVKQATGEGTNVWGDILNNGAFQLIDIAMDGVVAVSSSGSTTLTTANGATDQARNRILNYTGMTTGTITIPSLSKFYIVRAATANCIVTNGASSATVVAGDTQIVVTDGITVWLAFAADFGGRRGTNAATPVGPYDVVNKTYADSLALTGTGAFPGGTGNGGRFIQEKPDETGQQWSLGWVERAASFAADRGYWYAVNTTSGAVTATLPASPQDGDEVKLADVGATLALLGFETNALTIARNGATIQGLAEDMTVSTRAAHLTLRAKSGDWRIVQ